MSKEEAQSAMFKILQEVCEVRKGGGHVTGRKGEERQEGRGEAGRERSWGDRRRTCEEKLFGGRGLRFQRMSGTRARVKSET
eukprot:764898-Hanusia_phi.AAC.22